MNEKLQNFGDLFAKVLGTGLIGLIAVLIFLGAYTAFFPPYFEIQFELEWKWLELIAISYFAGIFIMLWTKAVIAVAIKKSIEEQSKR